MQRRRKLPSINIVPLVDVLTVLVFFFMVTMQFKTMRTLNITAPQIETAGSNRVDEQVVIAIEENGTIYLNDQPIEMDAFLRAVSTIGTLTPEIPVLLIADENAALKHMTSVMDACRANRLNKICLQSR